MRPARRGQSCRWPDGEGDQESDTCAKRQDWGQLNEPQAQKDLGTPTLCCAIQALAKVVKSQSARVNGVGSGLKFRIWKKQTHRRDRII